MSWNTYRKTDTPSSNDRAAFEAGAEKESGSEYIVTGGMILLILGKETTFGNVSSGACALIATAVIAANNMLTRILFDLGHQLVN